MKAADLNKIRGNRMAMIFQEPMTSLNPSWSIGNQLEEGWLRHRGGPASAARERALESLDEMLAKLRACQVAARELQAQGLTSSLLDRLQTK